MEGMRASRWRPVVAAAVVIAGLMLSAAPCVALTVVEVWRVPFDSPSEVTVSPEDGSCVFVSDGDIVRIDAGGSLVQQLSGTFQAAAMNAQDRSVWATDDTTGQLTHFAADGTELWQGGGYQFGAWPWSHYLDVNPVDGSVWFGDSEYVGGAATLFHLAEDGTPLWQSLDDLPIPSISAVSVSPDDGSCWITATAWFLVHVVSHYAEDGTLLWSGWTYRPLSISANEADGSVWHTSSFSPAGPGDVYHLTANGSLLWNGEEGPFGSPYAVAVSPRDGACWVLDEGELIYHAEDGAALWRSAGYGTDYWDGGSLAVNPRDGSVRVSDTGNGAVVRLNVVSVPQAALVAVPEPGHPLTVHFEDWSLGTPTVWLWDFGDGATSAEQNPAHSYAARGTYTVTLTVSNECGCDTVSDCLPVLPPQCATRTPGYWFTHPEALLTAFAAITGDEDDVISLCDDCTVTPDDAMAIFWMVRGLRATLAQHLLAALFNDALLKPAPDDIIEEAMEVLCDPDATNAEISAALTPLAAYNQSGSAVAMVGLDFGSANPAEAREMASAGDVPDCAAPVSLLRPIGRSAPPSLAPLGTRGARRAW